LLADPKAVEQLVERGARLRTRYGDTGGSDGMPFVARRVTERHARLLHERDGADDDHEETGHLLTALGDMLPEQADRDPLDIVKALTADHVKQPSARGGALLEDALARVTTARCCSDAETEQVIEEALRALKLPAKTRGGTAKSGAEQLDSLVCRFYEDRDFNGRNVSIAFQGTKTYRRISRRALDRWGLHDAITSMWIDASEREVAGNAYLFEDDRFFGRYQRFSTNQADPTERVRRPYVGDRINDETTSILIVRRFADELGPIALATPGLVQTVDSVIRRSSQISKRGDAFFTWDLWPDGGDDHPDDRRRKLVELRIPIRVDVPHWFDYDGELRYWIYLYLDDGRVDGYVAHYGAWCETGLVGNKVLDGLMERAPRYIGQVESELQDQLKQLDALAPFRRLFYLPGDGGARGHTDDNVSLVLVRRTD
jgi:hypothetical protein